MFKSVWQREGQRRHAEVQYDLVCYRVYDNAKANAVMQKSNMILYVTECMTTQRPTPWCRSASWSCHSGKAWVMRHVSSSSTISRMNVPPSRMSMTMTWQTRRGRTCRKSPYRSRSHYVHCLFFLRDWCKTVVTCNTTLRWYNRFAPRPLFSVLNMVIVMVNFYKNAG